MTRRVGEYGVEVPLPQHVEHGTLHAYNRYKCRCDRCAPARLAYDRAYRALIKRRKNG